MTVMELAELVQELSGSKAGVIREPLPTDDPKVRRPDISRARELLDWEPKVDLRDGLGKTMDYFRTMI
jgi:nucleoside-diphosphate-sugar epimerase